MVNFYIVSFTFYWQLSLAGEITLFLIIFLLCINIFGQKMLEIEIKFIILRLIKLHFSNNHLST